MTAFHRHALTALALGVVTAASADAQGAPAAAKKCDIGTGGNANLNGARQYLQKALVASGKADERPSHLRNAIAALEKEEKGSNQVGRNWLLGKTLVAWTTVPAGKQGVMTRKAVGFTVDPQASINLFTAADTAFNYVTQNAPQCADSVTWYRRQAWVPLINAANAAANADKLDSAATLAKRALLIEPNLPYAYNILGVVAHSKNDEPAAMNYFKQVAMTSVGDTTETVRTIRTTALLNAAVLAQNVAETADDAAKKAELNKEAVGLWREYLKVKPEDANAKSAMARALRASGDTAALMATYSEVLADPSKYSDQQLVEAGVAFVNNGRPADGIKLFEAALAQNAFNREALFDLATTHHQMGAADKGIPFVRRLLDIDPNNADNWKLLAAAYQAQLSSATDGKAKKAATDSMLAIMRKADAMPVRVTFTNFGRAGGKQILSGIVENLGAAPSAYALKIDFLDKSGNVVATQTANVGPVAPKASQPFTVSAEQSGIVAYRSAPLQ